MYAEGGEARGNPILLCQHILHRDIEILEGSPTGSHDLINPLNARRAGKRHMQNEAGGQQLIGGVEVSFGGSNLEEAAHSSLILLNRHL
jgi:hypothetical protein